MGKLTKSKKKEDKQAASKSEKILQNVSSSDKAIQKKQKPKKKKSILPKPEELLTQLLQDDGGADAKSDANPLQEYKIIKWKASPESEAVNHLFVKKHVAPIAELNKEKPPGRTLLCHNVPPYLVESHIKSIFRPFGNVTKIIIQQRPSSSIPNRSTSNLFPSEKDFIKGFKVAYVIFSDWKCVNEIMELDPNDVEPVILDKRPTGGIHRWMFQYNKKIVPTAELEKSVRTFMENFDREELKRKEMEKNAGEPDDEGWVTVTRSGKRASGGLVRSETMEERLKAKKRRQDKQLMNLTPAQVKESKMKQMIELRKKFEEDKQRIALMKQQRKFKPF